LYSKNQSSELKTETISIQNSILIGIEIEKKLLSVCIDSRNGNVDFDFGSLNQDIKIYKTKFQVNFFVILSKFLQKILLQDPLQFPQVLILFKKLLLLSASNKFLLSNSAKFYPERGSNADNFKAVTYQSYGIHFTRQDSSYKPVKIIFSHRIEFDEIFEIASVRTDIQFSLLDSQTSDQASLVHKSSRIQRILLLNFVAIGLVPFDLKRITQEFGDLLTNKRCMAYYGFEINRLESMTRRNTGVSLNDTQAFVPLTLFILNYIE